MILRRTATTAPGPWTTEPGTMPGSIFVLDATGARVCLVIDRPRIAEFIARHGPAEGDDIDAWRNRIALAAVEADLAVPPAAVMGGGAGSSVRVSFRERALRLFLRRRRRALRA